MSEIESAVQKSKIELKTKQEINTMKKAGKMAAQVLEELGRFVRSGVTTIELDQIAERMVRRLGGIPTFLGYRGYPATICVSINEEVVHGIPSSRKIKTGDIVSLDFAATVDGFVGDIAKTWVIEPVTNEARKLVEVTEQCLRLAIEIMKPGKRLGDIGHAVQAYAQKYGYGVVRDFVGHGIGRQMHEEPAVPNFGKPDTGIKLEPGLVLAVEPMVTMGGSDVRVLSDGWTVVTRDNSLAAHFEHTIAITEEGPVVLTNPR